MAVLERREVYSHAMIDCSDMTITEYSVNGAQTYDFKKLLERWAGVPDIEIEIRQKILLPEEGEDIESKI